MVSRYRHIFGIIFFLLIASCSGGGCSSGCSGCGGSTPLPGGFPKDKAIDNAASVRVSRPGLDFLETNLPSVVATVAKAPGGIFGLDIPNTDPPKAQIANIGLGALYIDPNICPGGPDPKAVPPKCHADVNIGGSTFQIDSIKPNAVTIKAAVPLKLEDTPIEADLRADPFIGSEIGIGGITLHIGYGDGGCSGGKPVVTPHTIPLSITIPLVEETTPPRNGYMKMDVGNAAVDLSGLNENDIKVCMNCGFAAQVCSAVTNSSFVKNLVLDQLKGQLEGQVRKFLSDGLCTAPSAGLNPPCPTNTSPDDGNKKCVFNADRGKCVSTLLGTDAHVDLSGLLKSVSPGTVGGIDFGLAAAGSMKPFPNGDANGAGRTPNGITLGMIGGVVPQPLSKCVPQATLTVPTGIPLPDELSPTTNDAPTTPHLGIALAGRFLDYSLGSVYNSGLLCLGISSEQFDMLRAGLLSILIPSMKSLTFEQGDAAAAIATRPQAAPTVKIGGGTDVNTDPILSVTLPKFALDFYLWHLDRFVRVFTFQADLTIPVNLQTGKDPVTNPKGGIIPVIGDIKVTNGVVENADLLMDDPALVASSLSGLLSGIGKQIVGSGFKPIDLSSALKSLSLGLEITQVKKLTKGNDDFVGLFANLSKAAAAATVEADTMAKLASKHVPAEHMQLSTMNDGTLPELVVDVSSPLADGRHAIEYSWWVDNGTRSAWAPASAPGEARPTDSEAAGGIADVLPARRPSTHLVIRDGQLLLQGHHVLKVAARVVGQSDSEDATPAEVPFTIDALPPFVKAVKDGNFVRISAWDIVSAETSLVGRYRLDEGAFGEWRSLGDIARVEAGTAATIDVEVKDEEGNVRSIRQELIRGKADVTLAVAGGCGCSTPGTRDSGSNGIAAVALGLAGLALIAFRRLPRRAPRFNAAALALGTIGVVAATSQGCACGSEASDTSGCGSDCNQECKEPLQLGRPGSYTSLAKASDGTIWLAGYNDALISEGDAQLFGDLVVGKYDGATQRVAWATIDGIPVRKDSTCADRSSASWRNGETDAGDNVGLWTSIQLSPDGHPMVSYYDSTNKKLKFAIENDGWKTFTLREHAGGDAGRFSKMVLVDGKPVVAFLQIEPGNAGRTRSRVVVARAKVALPGTAEDFRFEDAAVEEDNPCGASTCGTGEVCLKAEGICTLMVTGCTPATCSTGKKCVSEDNAAVCLAVKTELNTTPDVFGDYISLAQNAGRLGIVVYDRPHGNLVALVEKSVGSWDRVIVDGETGSRADKTALDTGDVGISASLAIDSTNRWHISYVSGLDESLRYITVDGGKVGRAELIDDGTEIAGQPFADGKHIVGDDSVIRAQGDVITVYYQDATVGTLRRATGTSSSGHAHTWTVRVVPQPNRFAGYSPQMVPGEDRVSNFWEETDRVGHSRPGDVAILSP